MCLKETFKSNRSRIQTILTFCVCVCFKKIIMKYLCDQLLLLQHSTALWQKSTCDMKGWRWSPQLSLKWSSTWTRWASSTSWTTAVSRAVQCSNCLTAGSDQCRYGWSSSPPRDICPQGRSGADSRHWWLKPWINVLTGTSFLFNIINIVG